MTNRDLIVVGASAGGVEALQALVAGLPVDLPATVLVVLHLPEGGRSVLPEILTRCGPLPALHPDDGHPLRHGEILVAPPDRHLTVRDGAARLSHGPRENGHQPAVDPLFRAAARWRGPRVIGVILSGTLDDGTSGQAAVAAQGGITVVQDPDEALYPGMPLSVLDHVPVDHIASAAELGGLLGRLSRERFDVKPGTLSPPRTAAHGREPADVISNDPTSTEPRDPSGDPAGLGCPQCGGSLYEIGDGYLLRYRCRVGHAWSPDSLLAEQSDALESALWLALRTLEDRGSLCRRAERAAHARRQDHVARRFQVQAREAEGATRMMRQALERARFAVRNDLDAEVTAAGPLIE
jgi:two-component system chemotaxis response regulator CheB